MSKRIDTKTGMKLPKGDNKRTWRRWKNANSSRERNTIRFMNRIKVYAKKFGLTSEQADEFSFTG
jgi:transcription initiation factor TFIIIB Brf1 subunit/transcription initiation factor TFIIB